MKKKIIIIVCILIFCSGCESHADKTTNTNSNQKNNKDVIEEAVEPTASSSIMSKRTSLCFVILQPFSRNL